jgi:hypothetical protein
VGRALQERSLTDEVRPALVPTVRRVQRNIEFSTPQFLFDAPRVVSDEYRKNYAATADGHRFLFNVVDESAAPINVLSHSCSNASSVPPN